MDALFARQNDLIKAIEQICINFRKDGPGRKNEEYIQRKLSRMDELWIEFDKNNTDLAEFNDVSGEYFTKNIYGRMLEYYESERKVIANYPVASTSKVQNDPEEGTQTPVIEKLQFEVPTRTVEHRGTVPCGPTEELLSQQRTNFRALSRIISRINVEEMEEKWEIEDQLKDLQYRWRVIDELHLRIDNMLQGQDLRYELEFEKHEDDYNKIRKQLNRKLSSTAHLQQSTPKVEIPIFTGKYAQWPTFFDLFTETIHNNNGLSKTQKMQHLKSKVKGEAERLIYHLPISSDNYDTAWEVLSHRYNNPHALFTNQIETFLNQPAIHKQTSFELKRLHDTTMECIHAIHNLGVDTHTWDPLLVHLIAKKLDSDTYIDYKEARKNPRDLPSLDELMNFIESKFTALEPINKKDKYLSEGSSNATHPSTARGPIFNNNRKFQRNYQSVPAFTPKCPLCQAAHDLYKCRRFLNLPSEVKIRSLTKQQICHNCLYKHYDKPCISKRRCKFCEGEHNSIIHEDIMKMQSLTPKLSTNTAKSASSTSNINENKLPTDKQHNVGHVAAKDEEILLTTLSLKVKAADGTYVVLRALLDQGSQISLISENAAQLLGLPRQRFQASVSGVGASYKQSKGMVTLECESIYGDYSFTTQALVISRVINNLPNISFAKRPWPHLQNINLADPEYNLSKPINLLLDASIYSEILMSGLIKGSPLAPIAQQTKLGWILSGNVKTFNCNVVINEVDDISRFWEVEDISQPSSTLSEQEKYCEDLYQLTTRRREDGRYEVALPMKPGFEEKLGSSKPKAVMQFKHLEKRMSTNETLSESYKKFINEYEKLHHMRLADTMTSQPTCYLSHHGVLKLDSNTSALRVVFNASSKTSSGYSLNDLMECGPNLQQDLQGLIMKWRTHKYVVTADIEKMFRQFIIREADQPLQTIIWRESPEEALREYCLVTVTYGMKASPYLAMRTLRQIGRDNAEDYPLAAISLENCFYTDDLMTGHDSLEQLQELQRQLVLVLKSAGLNLRKWSSNIPELVEDLPTSQQNSTFEFKDSQSRKTLGLRWNPTSDSFTFKNKIEYQENEGDCTKRQLLSDISKIYDPLGWLSPITIKAKLLFQRTWLIDMKWDDKLPMEIMNEWRCLREELKTIDKFEIPRYLGNKESYQLMGFSDASEKSYACVIYAVTNNDKGEYTSCLVAAKTKVAPQAKQLSLPRLELLGAVLLSQLMNKVIESMAANQITIAAWTDSMVVLGWLHGDVSRWKPFVANRVRQITDIIPASNWQHVKSEENAADCATRGLTSTKLQESIWWNGPQWLTSSDHNNIRVPTEKIETPTIEVKKAHVNTALCQETIISELINKCSSFICIVRLVGWISRFIARLRNRRNRVNEPAIIMALTTNELQAAHNLIIKHVQALEFTDDIYHLKKNKHVRRESRISKLNPFLDEHDILRVGGRLRHSNLSFSAKHPALLPPHSRLTELIIHEAHILTLHSGARLTLTFIREKYWITRGIQTVKKQLRLCVKCKRFSPEIEQQIMADLPPQRVTPSRPFTNTGVDFTGHVEIKANKGRGIKTTKGYVAVFVCLATKAVHLELVTDLSTPAFLAAFRRMCARRGTPQNMFSDNGTNFLGGARLLKEEYKAIVKTLDTSFMKNVNEMAVNWHFNAPAWPNASGLMESAVKSMKHHLKRVLGEQKLTYEEFITLLHQIEACMNSRPLCQLTEDPEDDYLTPGHFLIGGSLLSRPQTDPANMNLPARWQLVQHMNKHFWKMWSGEYLQQLQARSKWTKPRKNIKIGDLVIIREDNLPPGKWALGRVQEVHPGKDGFVRVVTLKTQNNIMKRPVNKLIILPVQKSNEEQMEKTQETPQPTPQDEIKNERPRRKRNAFKHFMSLTLLMLLSLITSSTQSGVPYNVTHLPANQGLYFDKIADLQHVRDEFKLVIYYNMTTYWRGLSDIKQYVTNLQSVTHNRSPQYKAITEQLQHEIDELKHFNSLITNQNKRQKRGLVNGVGYIANSLFGVLDERFADQYRKDIEKVAQNENHLQHLIKNQTLIIESEYNIFRRSENNMNKQLTYIKEHLRNMSLEVSQVRLDNQNELYITSSALTATIILSNLRRIQQTLIATVTDITHGRIDAHLFPPEQLEAQVNIIQGQLHGELAVPVDSSNIRQLYRMLKVFARVVKDYLIIEVRVPLVSNEMYELDYIITVPQKKEDRIMQHIIPSLPYIAFNLKRDMALFLSHNDIQQCLHTQADRLLCSLDKPIYDISIKQSICDIMLVNTASTNPTPCAAQSVPCAADKWIKLHRKNVWLFSCCEQCSMRTLCPAGMEILHVTGNGLLNLGQGCTIKGDTYTMYSHNNFLNHVQQQPDVPGTPKISVLNTVINTSMTKVDVAPPLERYQGDWNHLKVQIDELEEASSRQLSTHDVHHYSLSYVMLGGMILLSGIICYMWRRWTLSRVEPPRQAAATPPPVPLPRARSTTSVHRGCSPIASRIEFQIPRSIELDINSV